MTTEAPHAAIVYPSVNLGDERQLADMPYRVCPVCGDHIPTNYVSHAQPWTKPDTYAVHFEVDHLPPQTIGRRLLDAEPGDRRVMACAVAVLRARSEILRDVLAGTVDDDVASFSELHNFVDANCYGGLCDDDAGFGWNADGTINFAETNAYQTLVDCWIREGYLLQEASLIRAEPSFVNRTKLMEAVAGLGEKLGDDDVFVGIEGTGGGCEALIVSPKGTWGTGDGDFYVMVTDTEDATIDGPGPYMVGAYDDTGTEERLIADQVPLDRVAATIVDMFARIAVAPKCSACGLRFDVLDLEAKCWAPGSAEKRHHVS